MCFNLVTLLYHWNLTFLLPFARFDSKLPNPMCERIFAQKILKTWLSFLSRKRNGPRNSLKKLIEKVVNFYLLLKTSNLIFLILQNAQRSTVLSNINIFISLYLYKISSGPSNTGTFNIKNIDINKQSIMYIYRNTGTPYKC